MCARHTRVFSLNIDRHRHQIIHEIQATNCRVKLHPFRLLLDTEALPHIGGYRFKARFFKKAYPECNEKHTQSNMWDLKISEVSVHILVRVFQLMWCDVSRLRAAGCMCSCLSVTAGPATLILPVFLLLICLCHYLSLANTRGQIKLGFIQSRRSSHHS